MVAQIRIANRSRLCRQPVAGHGSSCSDDETSRVKDEESSGRGQPLTFRFCILHFDL